MFVSVNALLVVAVVLATGVAGGRLARQVGMPGVTGQIAAGVLIGFFPWSIFMVPMLLDWYRGLRRQDAWRIGYLLIACWLGVFFVFFTRFCHFSSPCSFGLAVLFAFDHPCPSYFYCRSSSFGRTEKL